MYIPIIINMCIIGFNLWLCHSNFKEHKRIIKLGAEIDLLLKAAKHQQNRQIKNDFKAKKKPAVIKEFKPKDDDVSN